MATNTSSPTTSMTREAPSLARRKHGTERAGGIAGLLVPAACIVAVYGTAVDGPNLRQGAFPWAAAAGCVLAAMTVTALARRHDRRWGRVRRAIARVTAAGLVGVAAFFVVLGGEDLLNRTLGTTRVLSDSDLLTGLGTLAASVLAIVVVPVGLFLVGLFTARAGVLGRLASAAMLAVGPVLVLGTLVTGVTQTLWISATWPLALGGCWAVVGSTLLRGGGDR